MYASMISGALAKKISYINIDAVVTYTALAIVALSSIVLYVLAVGEWLPSLLIVKRHTAGDLRDRGLKKYVFPEGRGVVYQPSMRSRKYMKKYMLFCFEGKRYIRCMFNSEVKSAYFELLIYDNQNNIIKSVDIYAPIGNTPYTEAILIPEQTSHACVTVLQVNGRDVEQSAADKKWLRDELWRRRGIYTVLTVAATFIESTLAISLLKYFWDLFFKTYYNTTFKEYVGRSGAGVQFFITVAVGLAVSALGILLHRPRNSNKQK